VRFSKQLTKQGKTRVLLAGKQPPFCSIE